MKKFKHIFSYFTILLVICQVCLCFAAPSSVSAKSKSSTDNFYFSDFTADYYLTRDGEGKSHLKVVENLTAVFPDTDQNHGIVRTIPKENQKGEAHFRVLPEQLDIKVKHNGNYETPNKIENKASSYVVYIQDPDTYVHGTQKYTLEYEFDNVVTAFDAAGNLTFDSAAEAFQELYWNTNGTGWNQPFNNLTARVHIPDAELAKAWTGESWCYVGAAYSSDQSRCTTTKISDGVQFIARNLSAKENLTFDLKLKPQTFTITPLPNNYTVLILGIILAIGMIVSIILVVRAWMLSKPQRKAYKDALKPVQYIPMRGISAAEMGDLHPKNYANKRNRGLIATIMELAVNHKITFVKDEEGKSDWKIQVNDLKDVPETSITVLTILNQGVQPQTGETFEVVKKQKYNSALRTLTTERDSTLQEGLVQKKLINTTASTSKTFKLLLTIFSLMILVPIVVIFLGAWLAGQVALGSYLIGESLLWLMITPTIIVMAACLVVAVREQRYSRLTDKGIECASYLDGLKEYISLAEADRLKTLQSVKGADTSPNGIVKLYEKLLPYAILFGLEKSWLAELNRYYDRDDVNVATWYVGMHAFRWSDFSSFSSGMSGSISSGSGSGGGGFSGGGGGGGGGGGC